MNGSIIADATETAHRRGASCTADAVRAARDPAESSAPVGEARVSSTRSCTLPLHVEFGVRQRNRTARSHRRGDGRSEAHC